MIGPQMEDKRSVPCWKEFLEDLERKRLDGSKVILGVMDGLPGLEVVFKEAFPKAEVLISPSIRSAYKSVDKTPKNKTP